MTKDDLLAVVKKNPISIGCGVLSLALVAVIYFRADELPAAEEELGKRTAEAERYAANLQNAAQLKEQLDALAAAGKEVDARLAHASQTLNNYQFFYKLESETGMKMTVLSQLPVGKNTGKSASVSVPFTITVQGTMAQALDYLRRLESGARYVRIMTVTCGVVATERSSPVTLALNLELLGVP